MKQSVCSQCEPKTYSDTLGSVFCKTCRGELNTEKKKSERNVTSPCAQFINELTHSCFCDVVCVCFLFSGGEYANVGGLTLCSLCKEGTYRFKSEQAVCDECAPGQVAEKKGTIMCSFCSPGLSILSAFLRHCSSGASCRQECVKQ
jgi:hypothetical protein